jgi:hypothetical protein
MIRSQERQAWTRFMEKRQLRDGQRVEPAGSRLGKDHPGKRWKPSSTTLFARPSSDRLSRRVHLDREFGALLLDLTARNSTISVERLLRELPNCLEHKANYLAAPT